MARSVSSSKSPSVVRSAAVLATALALAFAPQLVAATFTVSNANDAGGGSLRQAVADANAAAGVDLVVFDAAVTGTIALTSGEIQISDSLTITGPGSANLTVSGSSVSRIFHVYDPLALIDVTITGLTLTDGEAGEDSGGGILSDESLTLDDVVVTNSIAGCCGGGIAAFDTDDPVALTIRNSTISGNSADSGGGLGFDMAFPESVVLIQNTTITGNVAATSGGGIDSFYADGTLTIENSRITNNTALDGGGIGLMFSFDVSVRGTTISGNTATEAAGGAISLFTPDTFNLENSILSGNRAAAAGGAIAVVGTFDFFIGSTTVSGNVTDLGPGGGIAIGGVYGPTRLQNSTISGNSAGGAADGYGGGIDVYDVVVPGAFTAEFATITGNDAGAAAGGMYAFGSEPIALISTVIAGNTAPANPDVEGDFLATSPSFVGVPGPGVSGTFLSGDPQLGPLADNGGSTLTHMPLAGSPLLGAGANPSALTTDQRGTPRAREVPAGDPDIGAVEVQALDGPAVFVFDPASLAVNEGAGSVSVDVTRTTNSGSASVDVVVTGGSATGAGVDFSDPGQTLSFADLEVTKTITFSIVQDALDEADETITLGLTNAVNGTVGAPSSTTVTILDDEAGTIQFDPVIYSAGESDGTASLTVTRTGAMDVPVSADVTVSGGTATGGVDYTFVPQTVSWAAGESGARNVSVAITSDGLDEPDETIDFSLGGITGGASTGAVSAQMTIVDDDAPGILEFAQAAYSVNEDGGSVAVTLTRVAGVAGDVTVDVAVSGGSATEGSDYALATTTVAWADGDAASKTIAIPITDDSLLEGDETIDLMLQNPTGAAAIGAQSATTITIVDEDSAGTLQFAEASYSVAEGGGAIVVSVTRSGGNDGAVTVDVAVAGGTASGGIDYTFAGGTLAWADGDATPKSFSIPVVDDSLIEPSETIQLALGNATNGALIGALSTTEVTITDDDVAGALGFGAATYTVNEVDGTITISVSRTGGSDGEVTVDVVAAGTATNGVDFTLGTTTLVWADGDDGPKSITITIANDGMVEVPETIVLELQNPTGGATLARAVTTVTIVSAAVAAIPTLDGWMRILLAGFLGLTAVIVMGRNRFLAGVMLGALLLSSVPVAAAPEAQRVPHPDGIELATLEKEGRTFKLQLMNGESLALDEAKVRLFARGRRGQARRVQTVVAGEKARVFVVRNRDGQVLFARVLVGGRDAVGASARQ